MLERLIIENVALIDRLDLELGRGFTVLTGETGAGKSIIIDGIELVLGGRGSRELITHGKQKCRAEAVFDIGGEPQAQKALEELGIEAEDGVVTVMRELNVNGKSTARVNGVLLPVAMLKTLTGCLADIHGQHEHQSLLDDKNHLGVIDAYGEKSIAPAAARTAELYGRYAAVRQKLNAGFMSEAERERRIDILKYQINEIESASPKAGEEESIKEELTLLTNAERIADALSEAGGALGGEPGAVSLLKQAADALSGVAGFSKQYEELSGRLLDLYYEVEDASYTVRDLRLSAEFDPKRIDELEGRLDVLDGLKHKYGRTVGEVLEFAAAARRELDSLTSGAEQREKLQAEKAALEAEYFSAAAELTDARKKAAGELCALAREQLTALGMKKARISAEFSAPESPEPRENGMDEVRLLLSANEGEPLKSLSKVASGGELSRIMLALKTVITDADGIPTLIFDEVDTGISGAAANTVGLRMKHIAARHQVLCVTHLPQIAAFADTHFAVSKHEEDGRTVTRVKRLEGAERPAELARIMGAEGDISAAVSHAEELIKKASEAVL